MIERTFVMLKPDAVQRGLIGRILQRFEDAGLKIIAMKMLSPDKQLALQHYADVAERRGKFVQEKLVNFLTRSGPVLALVIEGVHAVEVVRKIVGPTEPKEATPGTIRGDFAHLSFVYADAKNKAVTNLIHASSSKEEAEKEILLWFKPEELHSYKLSYEDHVL